jgi:hypothetical protein
VFDVSRAASVRGEEERSTCGPRPEGVPGAWSAIGVSEISVIWKGELTHARENVVIRAQAQEQEQRHEPHADGEERGDVHKRRPCLSPCGLPKPPGRAIEPLGLLRLFRKVEEPEKVIGDDHAARTEESGARERDEGPCGGEILEVDEVCGDGEEDEEEREAVDEVEGDVECDDGLRGC